MKKLLFILTALILLLTATACNIASEQESKDEQTSKETNTEIITGQVTAIDGSSITIAIISNENKNEENTNQQVDLLLKNQTLELLNQEELPPDKPDGENGQDATPPDIPDGENGQGTTPPDIPDGENGQGTTPPDKPDGENDQQGNFKNNQNNITFTGETRIIEITDTSVLYKKQLETETNASLSDISINSFLTITYNEDSIITKILIAAENDFRDNGGNGGNSGNDGGGQNQPGGQTSEVIYAGATEITTATEESNKTYSSETTDQSALLINTADNVVINNPTVTKTGDSNGGDNCNFYGQNATLLVMGGSVTTIDGGSISSSANGANGVFSYGGNGGQNGVTGDGTTVIISDTIITTTGNGSGGIMTTGGGITQTNNLTIITSGQSSAAIRTDRGGGTVTVIGGEYTTNGLGSPSIYSTANITVTDAILISNLSEGVCIEGLNSITLNNTNLTANNTQRNGNAKFCDTIMIYQSMSGDAASGTSSFIMNGGSLTSKNGHVIHVTNTSAVIALDGVTITNDDSDNIFLSVCDDGWSGGSNTAVLNAKNQILNGGILVGDNSSLTISLSSESQFTGYISGNIENELGQTISNTCGTVSVTLESNSTWTLTADTYITDFSGNAQDVISNGYTLYVNGVALTGTR